MRVRVKTKQEIDYWKLNIQSEDRKPRWYSDIKYLYGQEIEVEYVEHVHGNYYKTVGKTSDYQALPPDWVVRL